MEKINLTKVSEETRKVIKKQVINLFKKKIKHQEIADTLDISLQAVRRTSSVYKKEGADCLKEKKRGRKFGEKRQLSPEHEKEIQCIIIDKCPNQLMEH